MICTVCGEEIGEEAKYMVVFRQVGGYRMLVGCGHNKAEWEQTLNQLPAQLQDMIIGVAGSFDCLIEMIKQEHGDDVCACEKYPQEKPIGQEVGTWLN